MNVEVDVTVLTISPKLLALRQNLCSVYESLDFMVELRRIMKYKLKICVKMLTLLVYQL